MRLDGRMGNGERAKEEPIKFVAAQNKRAEPGQDRVVFFHLLVFSRYSEIVIYIITVGNKPFVHVEQQQTNTTTDK